MQSSQLSESISLRFSKGLVHLDETDQVVHFAYDAGSYCIGPGIVFQRSVYRIVAVCDLSIIYPVSSKFDMKSAVNEQGFLTLCIPVPRSLSSEVGRVSINTCCCDALSLENGSNNYFPSASSRCIFMRRRTTLNSRLNDKMLWLARD